MTHQADITKLLRDASSLLGRERIRELLPLHMAIWISDHDTGCQIWIRLSEDPQTATVADICAWQGSIWYSSAYEFNDHGRTLGFNPETDFVMGPIEEFFARVEDAYTNASLNRMANEEQRRAEADQEHGEKLTKLRKLFKANQ